MPQRTQNQKIQLLLKRLGKIGESISRIPSALALIGLGSVGLDLDRLDEFSDLDFFVIVQAGRKPEYLEDLSWLTDVAPVAYAFANTEDGFKLLFEDGVFCEFAVFEEDELNEAVFPPGRIIWKAEDVDESIARPRKAAHIPQSQPIEKLVGEALTNLYVGMSRDHRGEILSAMRFIQGYAVDRILEITEQTSKTKRTGRDDFGLERRFEHRYPDMALLLPEFLQGYEKNRESALAILSFLDEHFEINPGIKGEILRLCQ